MIDAFANTLAFLIDGLNLMGFLVILWLAIVFAWRAI